ncbi:hypothetical protein DSECCO2_612690 [anaerobic digester metagenome]
MSRGLSEWGCRLRAGSGLTETVLLPQFHFQQAEKSGAWLVARLRFFMVCRRTAMRESGGRSQVPLCLKAFQLFHRGLDRLGYTAVVHSFYFRNLPEVHIFKIIGKQPLLLYLRQFANNGKSSMKRAHLSRPLLDNDYMYNFSLSVRLPNYGIVASIHLTHDHICVRELAVYIFIIHYGV